MWFLIIYTTMAVGSQHNGQTAFFVAKIVTSACFVTWFMQEPWLLETLFEILRRMCGIHWSAREWAFRVNLDLWIVYIGMFAALAVIKIREYRLTDHLYWPLSVKVVIGTSCVTVLWFFGFELHQESKFTYNLWHPYISFVPVLAFVVLRNASIVLRSTSSRVFTFIGRCSLETFIIQYHLWLAGDTKGILLVVPGTRWRPINFIITTIMFVYVSDRMAYATTDITGWICGKASNLLPITAPVSISPPSNHNLEESARFERGQEFIPLSDNEQPRKHTDSEPLHGAYTATGWTHQLAKVLPLSFLQGAWEPGVKAKLAIGVGIMWIGNIFWAH